MTQSNQKTKRIYKRAIKGSKRSKKAQQELEGPKKTQKEANGPPKSFVQPKGSKRTKEPKENKQRG